MLGLDDWIAHFSDGTTVAILIVVAIVLGLRHASDPDHLAAVTTLIAGGKERTKSAAARLGFAWGLGHGLTLFAFGLSIVLFKTYLPEPVQRGTETTIGLVIAALAIWVLVRWRRGIFRFEGDSHAHGIQARSPLQAFAIGLVHGMGGSAGVGVLLLAAIHDHTVAVLALGLFAFFTAVSMALLSTGLGLTLSREPVRRCFDRIAPALGAASLLFGVWYALGALAVTPYYL